MFVSSGMNKNIYSWVPDLPDQRDYAFTSTVARAPKLVDLRPQMPAVYDQGQLGSCTANAVAGASEFLWMKAGKTVVPSRLFIYYNERVIENTVSQDSGAMLRDGIKAIATYGECAETSWPYDISQFAVKPSPNCFTEALTHKALTYRRITSSLSSMRGALASGYPFVFGFTVYESFESDAVAATGIVPMPKSTEQVLGGHAVLAVGYDNSKNRFIVRNSWGPNWGDKGYCYMPFAYLVNTNLADDRWIVTSEN